MAIALLLLLPLPTDAFARRWPRLAIDLTDFGHPIVFAWFAHVLVRSFRARTSPHALTPLLWTLLFSACYGAITELAQGLVGRQPSMADFRNDMLGAGTVLLLHARAIPAMRNWRPWPAVVAAAFAGAAAAPLAVTVAAYAHRTVRLPTLWREDSALFAHLSRQHNAPGPQLAVLEPFADWRAYTHLEIEITNPESGPHPLVVRVHDLAHDLRYKDRYNGNFSVLPGAQTLRIPLGEVRAAPAGREMDMGRIRGVIVFSIAQPHPAEFRVHEIRLVRALSRGPVGDLQARPLPTP